MLRPLLAALLSCLPLLAPARPPNPSGPEGPAGVRYGVASALEKLRPGQPLPRGRRIDLAAARGECESAQIAVRPDHRLQAFTASSAPLDGPSRLQPALYRVATLELAAPSGPDGEAGPWPDPLVPERDPFFDEPRRAFPVKVEPGETVATWVELCVPPTARAGSYRGTVRLAEAGRELAAVAIVLKVWPFALPATSSFPVTFGLPTRVGTRALGHPDDPVLARALAAAALRHRVTPHGLSSDPPEGRCSAASCQLDFTTYDREVGPVLDGTLVPGVRGTFAEVRIPDRDWRGPEPDLVALLRAWRRHFDQRGWSDRLWLYTLDEPKPQDLPELARRARAAHSAGVRVFVTSVPVPALAPVVDAFAPNLLLFDARAAAALGELRAVGTARAAGRPFWYASCMSHGCEELPAPGLARARMEESFRGWPGYEIDRPGAAVRALSWLAHRERVAGELYYDMLRSWTGDPWKDVRAFAGNGDGTLLYPGLPAQLGGKHAFPVESIRLKLVRDGLEDRELLRLAERAGLRPLADRLVQRIAPSLRGFARDPAAYLAAHRQLGDAIAAAGQR